MNTPTKWHGYNGFLRLLPKFHHSWLNRMGTVTNRAHLSHVSQNLANRYASSSDWGEFVAFCIRSVENEFSRFYSETRRHQKLSRIGMVVFVCLSNVNSAHLKVTTGHHHDLYPSRRHKHTTHTWGCVCVSMFAECAGLCAHSHFGAGTRRTVWGTYKTAQHRIRTLLSSEVGLER